MVSNQGTEFLNYCLDKTNSRDKKILNIGCGRKQDIYNPNHFHVDELEEKDIPNFIQCNAEKMPFKDNEFDFIILIDMLEHCRHPFIVIKEACRVLKNGGYICTVNTVAFKKHGKEEGTYPQYDDYWRFLDDGIKLLLEENGFEILENTQLVVDAGEKIHTLAKK